MFAVDGLLPAIRTRRAGRAFRPDPVPADLQELLWEAAAFAPSHGNTQPARILVAASESVRERVVAALNPGNRHWAAAAPLLFALAADPAHDVVIETPGHPPRELYPLHAGIALGFLMLQAESLGLIAHPMAAFDEEAARAAFDAPPGVRIMAIVASGFPGDPGQLPADLAAKETAPRDRLPREHRVGIDRWSGALSVSARSLRKRSP